jgi:hypothetical protein
MDPRASRRRRYGGGGASPPVLRWGFTAVAAYGTYQLARWAVTKVLDKFDDDLFDEEQQEQDSPQSRMMEAVAEEVGLVSTSDDVAGGLSREPRGVDEDPPFQHCQEEVVTLMKELLPTLRSGVESATDCSSEVKKLKQLRKSKQAKNQASETNSDDNSNNVEEEKLLWETMKRKNMARLLLSVYAHDALLLLLYIQTHCLWSLGLDEEAIEEERPVMLQYTLQKFVSKFIPQVSARIEQSIAKRLQCWNVTQIMDIDMEEFVAGFSSVRWNIDSCTSTSDQSVLGLLVQSLDSEDSSDTTTKIRSPLTNTVIDRTCDILETPVCRKAWKGLNEYWFDYAEQAVLRTLFQVTTTSNLTEGEGGALGTKTLVSVLRGAKGCFDLFSSDKGKNSDASEGYTTMLKLCVGSGKDTVTLSSLNLSNLSLLATQMSHQKSPI